MKVSKLLLAIATVAAVSGCGMSSYLTSNQNQNSTTVVLSDNNYTVVRTVEATASATYVFGIGGLSKKALMSNAMSELSKKANLKGSQALINVSTKTHVESILVWMRYTVVTHGTVIEFRDKPGKVVTTQTEVIVKEAVPQTDEKPVVKPAEKAQEKPAQQPVKQGAPKLEGKAKYKDYYVKASAIDTAIRYRRLDEAKRLMADLQKWYDRYEEPNKLIEEDMESLQKSLDNLEK